MSKKIYKKYEDYHRKINGVEQKQCKDCSNWFDMNLENFGLVTKNSDGFNERCKTCQKKHNKESYNRTRDIQIERAKKRQQEHREELLPYYRKYNKTNWDRKFELMRKRYDEKTDEYKEYGKKYRQGNKDKVNEYSKKRREKNHIITEEEWYNCKLYFNFRCAYCGMTWEEHYEKYGEDLHKEHVIWDGKNDLANCIPSCQSCNSEKNAKPFNNWYNMNNNKFNQDNYNKIYLWLRYDYKKYIMPKRRYKGQHIEQRLKEIEMNKDK